MMIEDWSIKRNHIPSPHFARLPQPGRVRPHVAGRASKGLIILKKRGPKVVDPVTGLITLALSKAPGRNEP